MADVAVALGLLAWVATFGLLVVVPWIAVRVVTGALEVDVGRLVDRLTPSSVGPASEHPDVGVASAPHDEYAAEFAPPDRSGESARPDRSAESPQPDRSGESTHPDHPAGPVDTDHVAGDQPPGPRRSG